MLLIGEKGKLFAKGDYCETGYKLLGDTSDVKVEFPMPLNHFVELARAIQGGPQPTSNFANYSGPLTETILLGNLAVWAAADPNTPGKRIEWAAKTLTPTGAPELAAVVKPVYREGYSL